MQIIYFLFGAIIFLILVYIVLPSFYKKYIFHYPSKEFLNSGNICLTFDDGPDPKVTLEVLELLKSHGAIGTFFINGKSAERFPEIVKAIQKEGHIVGEHGYDHLNAWKVSPWQYWAELTTSKRILDECIGENEERYFRPAYGKVNLLTYLFMVRYKRKMILWNANSNDYKQITASEIVENVIRQHNAGCVVLMHDGCINYPEMGDVKIEAIQRILKHPRFSGKEFVAVDTTI